jgi:DNA-binding winged helix-turn-helix (wHTH) protein/pimeloyl-ACP methyl ester carboxylesterase
MIYAFDGYELDTERYELREGGAPIQLERQVFDLLAYLIQNSDRLVSKDELLDKIWGDRFVGEAALNTRVMAARKAIGDSGREQRLIKTVHRRGYRFVGEVRTPATRTDGAEEPAPAGKPGAEKESPLPAGAPSIQYVRTGDGVNIAYWSWGEGRPLIVLPDWIWSHIRSELRIPDVVNWYSALAARWRVIRYDGRGEGLSDRMESNLSLGGRVLDLEAVSGLFGPGAIFAHVTSTMTALTFAAEHPDRVTHLVLWCGYSRAEEFGKTPQLQALNGLVKHDWEMFVENIARARVTGWSSKIETEEFTRYLRDAATPEYARTAMDSLTTLDVSERLPRVKTPTLVIHCTGVHVPPIDAARGLATAIPNAQLCVLEGSAPVPHLGPIGPAIHALEEFLGSSPD